MTHPRDIPPGCPEAQGIIIPKLGLTRKDVAAELGVSPGTVDRLWREGAIPPPWINNGQTVRWHYMDLLERRKPRMRR